MGRTEHSRRQARGVAIVTGAGASIGLLFSLFYWGFEAGPLVNGTVLGTTIGLVSGLVENYLFQKAFRKQSFLAVLLTRSLFYIVLVGITILIEIKVYLNIRYGTPLTRIASDRTFTTFLLEGEFLAIILVCIVASFVLNFLRQINRLLGQNVLLNYITGRYYKPREEERIFMFLDMKSSTTIAERLGHIRFHELVNDFFFDITDPIVERHGEIYQYVGDEIVVTWSMERGLRNADCIRCFFSAVDRIDELSAVYVEKYGFVPGFKAGLHYGTVIVGEIGDVKKEIAFHGDAVNTTARIQAECNAHGARLLVSGELWQRLAHPDDLVAESKGSMLLRGKQQEVELLSVTRTTRR
jgi:adenylate cyclase